MDDFCHTFLKLKFLTQVSKLPLSWFQFSAGSLWPLFMTQIFKYYDDSDFSANDSDLSADNTNKPLLRNYEMFKCWYL